MKKKDFDKVYVLDTNVLLHESNSIYKFQDNLVVIPMCVLEELDRFKKGQDETARHSRQFSRYMDKLRVKGDLKKGVGLKTGGFLKVRTEDDLHLRKMIDIPDNRIIATALKEKEENPRKKVIVVSKDINLRVKADILGIRAEDYSNDKINFDSMYTGVMVHVIKAPIVPDLYTFKEIDPKDIPGLGRMFPNQYLVIKYGKQKGLARFDAGKKKLVSLIRADKTKGIWGIQPKNLEQTLALDMLLNDDIKLISLVGKAGTGKTLLSVAAGLHKSLDEESFKKIIISRPIIPMGKDLGYLPGTMEEKMNPWMKPIFDNVDFLLNGKDTTGKGFCVSGKELLEQNMMEVEPLTYIRGRSIPNQYMLIDEAQNLTPHEIKTIITRAGTGTKIVLTGDCHQIDNPFLDASSNGLSYIVERFKKEKISAHITLLKGERSELAEIASNIL